MGQELRNWLALLARFFFPGMGVDLLFFVGFFFLCFFFEIFCRRESVDSLSDDRLSHAGTINGCSCIRGLACDCRRSCGFAVLGAFAAFDAPPFFLCIFRDSTLCCLDCGFVGSSTVTSFNESALIVKNEVLPWHDSFTLELKFTIFCHLRRDFFFLDFRSTVCR